MPSINTTPSTALSLLESIISKGPNHTTTLIICSSRPAFLNNLQTSIETWRAPIPEIPASQEDEGEDLELQDAPSTDPAPQNQTEQQHTFTTPTLHLLATSRNVNLVFCPSINTLRAFIATYSPPPVSDETTHHPPSSSPKQTQLIIIDMLSLHHGTSEFTMQGLSRTFAATASMSHRTRTPTELIECVDTTDGTNTSRGPVLWDAEVPLLSGSIKLGGAGASWAGRRVVIRDIAKRWFDFEK